MATATLDRSTAEALDAGLTIKGNQSALNRSCVVISDPSIDSAYWTWDVHQCRTFLDEHETSNGEIWQAISIFADRSLDVTDYPGLLIPGRVEIETFRGKPMLVIRSRDGGRDIKAGRFKWGIFMAMASRINESNMLQKIGDVADQRPRDRKPRKDRIDATPKAVPAKGKAKGKGKATKPKPEPAKEVTLADAIALMTRLQSNPTPSNLQAAAGWAQFIAKKLPR